MENVPSTTWRMLAQRPNSAEPPLGLDALWHKAAGFARRLVCNRSRLLTQAESIVSMEKQLRHLSDRRLRETISPLHDRFRLGRDTAEDRHLAFAVLREVAARQIGLQPYPVQIAGALAMEAGGLAEMATGEGKTLVAVMPAVLAGWRGRGCHVVTANEYLAKRDAQLMQSVYAFCGLTVGCIEQDMPPAERRQAYAAHVTYGTNKEVAADFLRDQIAMGPLRGLPAALLARIAGGSDDRMGRLVQRGLDCAIVDEADAVLIDEAVTPLIISGAGPNQDQVEAFERAARLAKELNPTTEYRIDPRRGEVNFTPAGKQRLAELTESIGGLWTGCRRREEMVLQALTAREFFIRDKQYVIADNQVVIVDEFTGRLMPDRSWRNGLHQAVEAKEGLEIHLPKETYARISFQRFFRLYRKLSAMTGTGAEAQAELWQIYRLPVIPIPTHRPCRRTVMPERVFGSAAAKWEAIVDEIRRVHKTGRPVLIGTRSVGASEYLSRLLSAQGLEHQVLNAVRQDSEAQIIAGAGQIGRITVATNMAGRGTDIRLGSGVAELGGLHVVATERHEARRIDRQLFGRCARQGDPGSAQAFTSLDDELMQQYGHPLAVALARCGRKRNMEISSASSRRWVDKAQQRAERVARRQRKELLRADHWIDEFLGFTGTYF
ncbi:MAG: SecA domain protein [Acidobacteria bacterium]|nr:SecA domain protein [Acidobacteriota bacterium]